MNINLSWDLFVIVFFAVIIAYSFIVGRNKTLKIIIATYIAILAADGIGNLIKRYLIEEPSLSPPIQITNPEVALVIIKIFIFVATIVLVTTKGRFNLKMKKPKSTLTGVGLNFLYGILSAGLITSTILIYTSGASLLENGGGLMNATVMNMYNNSVMVQYVINYYNIWFALPAATFLISSFLGDGDE